LADEWFAALASDQPQVAHQLVSAYVQRARLSDRQELWAYYRNSADRGGALKSFVAEPLIRTLLTLDGRAQVRLYETLGITTPDEFHTHIAQSYAVTYGEGSSRTTFLVALTIERSTQRGTDRVDWRVASYSLVNRR
jgi:hypothetical protein